MSDPQNPILAILLENERRLKQTMTRENTSLGLAGFAIGDLLYADTTTTLARLADVAVGRYLRSGGVNTAPLWSTLVLPNAATQGDLMAATGANTIGSVADVAVNQVLKSGGVGALPAYGQVVMTTDVSDYTTAAYTPTYLGGTTAGATTYTTQVGRYIRIGNLVVATATVVWTAATGTGTAQVSLPFTAQNVANQNFAGSLWIVNVTYANGPPYVLLSPNTAFVSLFSSITNGANTAVAVEAAGSIVITIAYFV